VVQSPIIFPYERKGRTEKGMHKNTLLKVTTGNEALLGNYLLRNTSMGPFVNIIQVNPRE
jgi:hypothetical protein